jgi:citrate synthase
MTEKAYKLVDPDSKETVALPVHKPTLGPDVLDVTHLYSEHGVFTFDPGFAATASCESAITYIDGEKGVLLYRGYPIEQLAELSSFLEVSYLLLHGELPTDEQLKTFDHSIRTHTMINESLLRFFNGFHYNAHPMAMVSGVVASMSAFYHDSTDIRNPQDRDVFAHRIMAKLPTIAAAAYKHSLGQPFVYPQNRLDYCSNLLHMFFAVPSEEYAVNPVAAEALDLLFILHADHEQNCSTSAMRNIGSSHVDPYSALAGAAAALYGPLHGGANEAVVRMLEEIGSKQNIPGFIKRVKAGEGRLMGFGHRVYKSYDPRAKIIKRMADLVFEVTGKNPLLEMALELERIALEDDYFVTRRLYPNVDFYSGLIYQAMGFPLDMFPVLFAIPRTAGWMAQWEEMLTDSEQKIARPRQIYIGSPSRDYVSRDKRR